MEHPMTTLDQLPEEMLLKILKHLNNVDAFNLMQADLRLAKSIESSATFMLKFQLQINIETLRVFSNVNHMSKLAYKNVSIRSCKGADKPKKFLKIMENFRSSIEVLKVAEFQRITIQEFMDIFKNLSSLRILTMEKCKISEEVHNQFVNPLSLLEEVHFDKCDANCFKLFKRQEKVHTVLVSNDEWRWNGFSHDDFNDLAMTLKSLDTIVFNGSGTGSYFDFDHFPYKIRKLEAYLITFQWYVGIRHPRVSFFESQRGFLKDLKIHKLPYDFDGGGVLRYLIETMELETFYYGDIPLILNSQKQDIEGFEATGVQMSSMYEMFRQYPSIKRLKLFLSQTDIASNDVERIINPPTDKFQHVEHFELLDHSGQKRLLGVFLGLFKNLQNVKSIKLETHDQNINVFLNEFLHRMTQLERIEMDSTVPNAEDRFLTIRNLVPNLKLLKVAPQFIQLARDTFDETVDISEMVVRDY